MIEHRIMRANYLFDRLDNELDAIRVATSVDKTVSVLLKLKWNCRLAEESFYRIITFHERYVSVYTIF